MATTHVLVDNFWKNPERRNNEKEHWVATHQNKTYNTSNDQQRGYQREEQYEEHHYAANIRDVSSDDGSITKEERRTCV